MKLKAITALTIFFIFTTAAWGQPAVEIIGRYVRIQPRGANSFSDLATDYKQSSGSGFGIGANLYIAHPLSVEVSYGQINSDARLAAATTLPLGTLKLRPLTAALQWHPLPDGTIDPYVGGGAMYTMFDSLSGARLGDIGIGDIEFSNRFSPMLNGGISFRFMRSFAFDIDAKYAPLESSSRARFTSDATQSEPLDIKINPLLLSAGLRFRF